MKINKFGYAWNVRDTQGQIEGPGNNKWSQTNVVNNTDNILLDCGGCSAEIYLEQPLGYGLYEFEVECSPFLSKGIVAGIFLYKDDKNEVDIELGRWDKTFSRNAQHVLQKTGDKVRMFNFQSDNKMSIDFRKDKIICNLNGGVTTFYNSIDNNACVHINLWTYGTPAHEQIKLKDFKFTPYG